MATLKNLRSCTPAILIALALLGCATALPTMQPSRIEAATRPAIGVVAEAEIGDALFDTYTRTVVRGAEISGNRVIKTVGGTTIEVQTPLMLTTDGRYCGKMRQLTDLMGAPVGNVAWDVCYDEEAFAGLRNIGGIIEFRDVVLNTPNNFQQQLIYLGRSGSEIRISYREFLGDMARPAFSQDFQFDISASNIIGARGARIEILDAGNVSIRYRVLQPFSAR